MGEWGIVKEVSFGKAKIKLERKPICEKCGICHSEGKDFMLLEVEIGERARVGDKVRIQISAGKTLMATFIVFMIPLLALLTGIFIGYLISGWLGSPSFWEALFGLPFFFLSFFFVRWYEKKAEKDKDYYPHIVEIAKENSKGGRWS